MPAISKWPVISARLIRSSVWRRQSAPLAREWCPQWGQPEMKLATSHQFGDFLISLHVCGAIGPSEQKRPVVVEIMLDLHLMAKCIKADRRILGSPR
jgi:hypothetical protein